MKEKQPKKQPGETAKGTARLNSERSRKETQIEQQG
jgi:hypothetical protein